MGGNDNTGRTIIMKNVIVISLAAETFTSNI